MNFELRPIEPSEFRFIEPSLDEAIEFIEDIQKVIDIEIFRANNKISARELLDDDLSPYERDIKLKLTKNGINVEMHQIQFFDCYNCEHWSHIGIHFMCHEIECKDGRTCSCKGIIPKWFSDKYDVPDEFVGFYEIGG